MARVSVALCTYNGSRYVGEQLASIADQSRLPDELVACDDHSTDGTADRLRQFAATAPFHVTVRINPRRGGAARNFDQAIGLCTGDVIALADQDDVWRPRKLERLLGVIEQDPTVGLVFTDAEVVDDALRPLGYGFWDAIGFSSVEQQRIGTSEALGVLLRHQVVAGTTAAFRAEFRDLLRPIPATWVHDGWIALLIAGVGRLVAIPDRLVLYRQHDANQIGARRVWLWHRVARSDRDRTRRWHEASANGFREAGERLRKSGLVLTEPRAFDLIAEAVDHYQTRAALPAARWRRVSLVAREMLGGRYSRYSDGLMSAVQDLVQ